MRTVIITLTSLAVLYFLTAPKPFELREGNISSIAESDARFSVKYDYSDSKIYDLQGNLLSLSDYLNGQDYETVQNYPNELKDAEEAFVTTFNSFSKNGLIVADDSKAAYEMSVKLDQFCYGKSGGGVNTDSRGWATGSISLRDTTTGETLAVFDFNKVNACPSGKDARNLSLHRRRGYQLIAGYLARSFNNAK